MSRLVLKTKGARPGRGFLSPPSTMSMVHTQAQMELCCVHSPESRAEWDRPLPMHTYACEHQRAQDSGEGSHQHLQSHFPLNILCNKLGHFPDFRRVCQVLISRSWMINISGIQVIILEISIRLHSIVSLYFSIN